MPKCPRCSRDVGKYDVACPFCDFHFRVASESSAQGGSDIGKAPSYLGLPKFITEESSERRWTPAAPPGPARSKLWLQILVLLGGVAVAVFLFLRFQASPSSEKPAAEAVPTPPSKPANPAPVPAAPAREIRPEAPMESSSVQPSPALAERESRVGMVSTAMVVGKSSRKTVSKRIQAPKESRRSGAIHGAVYDLLTLQPVDVEMIFQEVNTAEAIPTATHSNGQYGFEPPPGWSKFTIRIKQEGYAGCSRAGKSAEMQGLVQEARRKMARELSTAVNCESFGSKEANRSDFDLFIAPK